MSYPTRASNRRAGVALPPRNSEVVGTQAGLLRNPREKCGPDFVAIMKGERIIRPCLTRKAAVGSVLPSHLPSDPK